MRFISIGSACSTKYQIDKCNRKEKTLFFDWLMTDMNSVISILNCTNIEEFLNVNNIVRDEKHPFHHNNSRVFIKSLSFCVSIHDISVEFNDKSIYDFIDKYKRRFTRMLELIKSKEKIYFIRFGKKIDENEKNKFIQTILKINKCCDFALISIIVNQEEKCIIKDDNYLEINIKKLQDVDKNDWTHSYLDWKQIFMEIKNNI